MFDAVWPTLPADFRTELVLQCVKHLKGAPGEHGAFALVVAQAIKARPQSVKAQWRMSDTFGTMRALAMNAKAAAPFLALTYMGVRKPEVAALYDALGVTHTDLEVDESSAGGSAPTTERFAAVLAQGVDGVSTDSLRCMVAIIADAGIESWQEPAREALSQYVGTGG